ncbi:unnamed protein product [Miscanthus lutarioriparius]|uniref:Uncharacterized protein n=1 Tax=Miscanthus lutarioriparius TaxID=422564 RepID=A0A811PG29_9POAL|nr:unnamed protein product [Miscanthus lutarioriparius]
MEEVAVSPMVAAALVLDNNGADDAVSSTAIPSVTVSVEEKEEINGDFSTITSAANNNDGELFTTPVSSRSPSTRKKRGAFGLFRAMFLSFGRSDSMKKTDDVGDTTSPNKKRAIAAAAHDHKPAGDEPPSWKHIVDGMRPLRLRGQELEYYPPPPPLGHAEVYHDVILPPPSPARSGFDFEEVGMTSRYASAEDLHQMDSADEEGVLAAEGGDGDGDSSCPHAIDMQAELFIAKFYEQFKSESFNGHPSE